MTLEYGARHRVVDRRVPLGRFLCLLFYLLRIDHSFRITVPIEDIYLVHRLHVHSFCSLSTHFLRCVNLRAYTLTWYYMRSSWPTEALFIEPHICRYITFCIVQIVMALKDLSTKGIRKNLNDATTIFQTLRDAQVYFRVSRSVESCPGVEAPAELPQQTKAEYSNNEIRRGMEKNRPPRVQSRIQRG